MRINVCPLTKWKSPFDMASQCVCVCVFVHVLVQECLIHYIWSTESNIREWMYITPHYIIKHDE